MLNQNTAHAKHPTTTPLRALKSSDCKKHGCQLLLKLRSGLVPAGSNKPLTPKLIQSFARAPCRRCNFFFAKRLWPEKCNFLKYLPELGPLLLLLMPGSFQQRGLRRGLAFD